ncbi:MAG: hypothetical protein V2A76_00495 [Planctomycetota bacterium]
MIRCVPRLSLLGVLIALLSGCGDGTAETPASRMAAADDAMAAHDYQKALDLYDSLITWKGEGTVPPEDRFKASIESVKCLIALHEPQEGVDRFHRMFTSFPELAAADAYKHTLAVLRTLVESGAEPKISIALLALAQEKYPEQKKKFGQLVPKLREQGLDSEAEAKLRTLGYLSIPEKKSENDERDENTGNE